MGTSIPEPFHVDKWCWCCTNCDNLSWLWPLDSCTRCFWSPIVSMHLTWGGGRLKMTLKFIWLHFQDTQTVPFQTLLTLTSIYKHFFWNLPIWAINFSLENAEFRLLEILNEIYMRWRKGVKLSIFSRQESFLPTVRLPGESDGYFPSGGKEEENGVPLPPYPTTPHHHH